MIDRFHRTKTLSRLIQISRAGRVSPLPNARMMLHVGAAAIENFLVVGEVLGTTNS
ncbi:MAG: hypothetical protein WB784_08675 [Rhodanobacteraceae bacterium]